MEKKVKGLGDIYKEVVQNKDLFSGIKANLITCEEVTSRLNDPLVQINLEIFTYENGYLYKGSHIEHICRKSLQDQAELIIPQGWEIKNKRVIELKIDYSVQEANDIKLCLKEASLGSKKKVMWLEDTLKILATQLKTYGIKSEDIVYAYPIRLIIYPQKYLEIALQPQHYKDFPSTNEIEKFIKDLDGVRSKFFYEINGY